MQRYSSDNVSVIIIAFDQLKNCFNEKNEKIRLLNKSKNEIIITKICQVTNKNNNLNCEKKQDREKSKDKEKDKLEIHNIPQIEEILKLNSFKKCLPISPQNEIYFSKLLTNYKSYMERLYKKYRMNLNSNYKE